MKLWTLPTAVAVVGLAAMAMAKTAFVKEFATIYGVPKSSTLGTANCSVCHVGKTAKLNVFGKDVQAAMKKEGSKLLTGAVLKKVEGLDSDKDGKTNIIEVKGDTLPGDPDSK